MEHNNTRYRVRANYTAENGDTVDKSFVVEESEVERCVNHCLRDVADWRGFNINVDEIGSVYPNPMIDGG